MGHVMRVLLATILTTMLVARAALAQEQPQLSPEARPIALRQLEARPFAGWALAPNSATGAFAGADAQFRIAPAFAMGVDGAWYEPFNAGAGASAKHPLNEADLSLDVDFTVFPLARRSGESVERFRGEAREGEEAGAFEPYLLGGLGVIRTRPIAVIDPSNRTFTWNNLVNLDVGVGARVFVSRFIAFTLELRDVLYYERVENPLVATGAPGLPASDPSSPANPGTWYDKDSHFTSDIQLRLGLSLLVGPGPAKGRD